MWMQRLVREGMRISDIKSDVFTKLVVEIVSDLNANDEVADLNLVDLTVS